MKNAAITQKKDIINVINDLDPTVQSKEYNDKFREWRRSKNNPCTFRFETNAKEKVFNDSRGFENKSLPEAECRTITAIMRLIGLAMLIYITIDNVLGTAIIYILDFIGINIHTNIFSSAVYGGATAIVATMVAISCLALIAPVIYLHKKLKMPFKVEFMSTVNDSAEILSSIGMAMVVCTIVCLPSAYSSSARDIYNYFRPIDTDLSIWNQKEFVIYTIFEIIVLSILTEAFLRGGLFAALRQFGDSFAIAVTTIVAALLTRDIYEMPAAILISIVASVGMLRSGTIITAFFVRIIYKLYLFALIILEVDTSSSMMINRNLFMLSVFIIGVAISMAVQLTNGRRHKKVFAAYHSEVTAASRLTFALRRLLFFMIAGICLLQALINALF
ncbi:MAG TPA: CPBP family intramembrane metalloprotease [Ruminococcus sp.]|nr:CPBP family intramembrane metalloprotease [Ruminococcus sp.]